MPEQAQRSQIEHDLARRKPDDIAVGAHDALDQERAQALCSVSTRLIQPLPTRRVACDFVGGSRAQADLGGHRTRRANLEGP